MDQDPTLESLEGKSAPKKDDLPPEDLEAARRKSRINALVLGLVFLLLTFGPHPWNTYAPLLFLVPLVYSLISRMRRTTIPSNPRTPTATDTSRLEPYASRQKDPNNPRKYKPIG